MKKRGKGWLALSPLVVFITVYVASSLIAGDFYRIPVCSAFLIAGIWSIIISDGRLQERVDRFSSGAGNSNVLMMVWIFILAGAFASSAREIGSVDATVNATMRIIPPSMLLAGLFLTACFISMSIGTSVGTIVALVPIATGIASQSGISVPFMTALIVGGALFGDNLSFISDTTIAATRAVGCRMKDKFLVNIHIAAPAVLIVTAVYLVMGRSVECLPPFAPVEFIKLLPYLLIILLAICGLNVMLILSVGIVVNAVIGFACGCFTWDSWLCSIGGGIQGMSDLIVVTLLAGGMLEMIRSNGGLDFIIDGMTSRIHGKKGAQMAIAAMTCVANLCTANNTIAIITTGRITRDITEKYHLDARKSASIMDTFSCFIQGIIPYGAQILMASGLAKCTPMEIIPYLYYPFLLGICAMMAILLGYPRKYSK